MRPYQPVFANRRDAMGQSPLPLVSPSLVPPTPTIDAVFAGYEGWQGVLTSLAVLGVTGSAAWVGIKTALGTQSMPLKAAGWVGGVGSALLGLLYLGAKTGLTIGTPVPAMTVYPG